MHPKRVLPEPPAPRPEGLVGEAYEALKASVLDLSLPPGHETTEPLIAEQLGMSRTPVHAAVLRLEGEGLLRVLPRRGVRVSPIEPAGLRDAYGVLIALEAAAAEALAGRRGSGVLAGMRAANEACAAALAADDMADWAAADDRFHRLLVEGCGNPVLARLASSMADHAQRARTATARLRPRPTRSVAEHGAILDAIAAGDAEAAREATRRHRARASAEILAALGG